MLMWSYVPFSAEVNVGIDGPEHRRAGAPKGMGQRSGPPPQAGRFFAGCSSRTGGERPVTKMGEGSQRMQTTDRLAESLDAPPRRSMEN